MFRTGDNPGRIGAMMGRQGMVEGKWKRRLRGFWWKLLLLFVVVSVAQVLALRFIDPPLSAFMIERWLGEALTGNPGFRISNDWRDLDAISPNLPVALVAAEDQNFATHNGFDFAAIERAQAHNQKMAERAQRRGTPVKRLRGASTISQQTAKNLFLWQGTGATRWLRKGLEVWYTALIEVLWPKRRILEIYANVAEFGDGVYGAQAASRRFFGKDAARLGPAEAARLAAVLPSPRRYSAAAPGPYVTRRAAAIQRQMRLIGGTGYLRALD